MNKHSKKQYDAAHSDTAGVSKKLLTGNFRRQQGRQGAQNWHKKEDSKPKMLNDCET